MEKTDRNDYAHSRDLPAGLRLALAQNAHAMAYFSGLTEEQRRSVVDGARAVRSSEGMKLYVARLGKSE